MRMYEFLGMMCAHKHRFLGRLEVKDPLELGLEMVVSHLMWALASKLSSSGRAEH